MTKEDLRAKVIAKAWKDPAFKKKLLSNPRAALKEMGYKIPDNIDVVVMEDTADAFTFVLPMAPSHLQQMSDTDLRKLAAASGTDCDPRGIRDAWTCACTIASVVG